MVEHHPQDLVDQETVGAHRRVPVGLAGEEAFLDLTPTVVESGAQHRQRARALLALGQV